MPQFDSNIITLSDSYKVSHAVQYPPKTEKIYSYLESRGGSESSDETCFFGLQYIIKRYLEGQVVTQEKIDHAARRFEAHFGSDKVFQKARWEYILNKHGGRLPISIHAVAEGTVVPTHNALMAIENTDPECFWLTNYLETVLQQVWAPLTVCTYSRDCKMLILKYLKRTGDPAGIGFKLHDFGFRGVSSVETSAILGAAHLVNFLGTDTFSAIELLDEYYHEDMAGFSIPAAEHSTITSWGQDNEVKAFKNMLEQYPTGLVAVVSDSYNIYEACDKLWGLSLRNKVLERDGTLVIRPDSGEPPHVVCKVLEILGRKFGYTENDQGFKVLNPHVRIIQGDGINKQMLDNILFRMQTHGWSADNIAFGSGGALLQKHNRDTYKIAIKCSHAVIDGEEVEVYKNPVDDPGKISKKGRLALVKRNGVFITVAEDSVDPEENHLIEVFRDGDLLVDQKLAEIRERAA